MGELEWEGFFCVFRESSYLWGLLIKHFGVGIIGVSALSIR